MNHLSHIIPVFLIAFTFACGGDSSTEKGQTDSTQTNEKTKDVTNENNKDAEEKLCFTSEEQLTKAYANFIINGESVTGMMRYETPKAGMTLYEVCNVKGTKKDDKLTLTFITVDTDSGQGLGESREEVWSLKGEELSQIPENVAGILKKTICAENALFKAEPPKKEAAQSYELDGVMDGKIKIKMFLTSKPNPENKKTILYEGYYYYLNQGKDKKIDLKGITNPMGLLQLDEVVGNKTFAKFMIEQASSLHEDFTCMWVSADGKKEIETVFKLVK